MNVAIIFAGGQGGRMTKSDRPKQFLEYRGKPVLVYTIDCFQNHPDVDDIIVVCLEDWIPYLKQQIDKYHLTKVKEVVVGGVTGQMSIYNGLRCANSLYPEDTVVLLHDGVRPLVSKETISDCIRETKKESSCVICMPAKETPIFRQTDSTFAVIKRSSAYTAKAPQGYILKEVMAIHEHAKEEGIIDFVDTCTMMYHYGHPFHTYLGSFENIKITTPADFMLFKSIEKAREEGEKLNFE